MSNLDKEMLSFLNQQIKEELYSAYLYLSMAAYFESINFKGFAKWMIVQAKEEEVHAMKFYHYIIERGDKVTLMQINAPKNKWKSPLDAFSDALDHEVKVTKLINHLMSVSKKLQDYATTSFLQWFVDEQVEEEVDANENVAKLKMAGDTNCVLLMLDHEFGKRE